MELDKDEHDVIPSQRDVALGIEFDLTLKRYRLDPNWTAKAHTRIHSILSQDVITLQDMYTISGTMVWFYFVMSKDLCHIPFTLQSVGRVAKAVADGARWCDPMQLCPQTREEITRASDLILSNDWTEPRKTFLPECEIWSDASKTHWAFLIFVKDVLVEAKCGLTKEDQHIFYSELSCALGGLSAAHRKGYASAKSCIDNAAAGGALQRGASSNFVANRWLAKRLLTQVEVEWVSTKIMLADPFTRPYPFKTTIPPLPPIGTKKDIIALFLERTNRLREIESLRRPGEQQQASPLKSDSL